MNNEITEIQVYERDIELAKAYKRLSENEDYKLIITELFLEQGSQNLAKNIVVVKDQESIVEQIKARGFLYRFLMDIENNGASAVEAIADLNEE